MSASDSVNAFELEGMVSTLTVLRLASADLAELEAQLRAKVRQMPGFFQDAPVVIDLESLEGKDEADTTATVGSDAGTLPETTPTVNDSGSDASSAGASSPTPDGPPELPRPQVDLAALTRLLKELRLVPVGVRNLPESRRADAVACGLGIMRSSGVKEKSASGTSSGGKVDKAGPGRPDGDDRRATGDRRAARGSGSAMSMTIKTPVRGGQVIYAEQRDAVVLSSVNSGAELIADGHIHIYGPLRGRALAGAHGREDVRIFCQKLEADLVSIAGHYMKADELPKDCRDKPAQISLRDGALVVEPL